MKYSSITVLLLVSAVAAPLFAQPVMPAPKEAAPQQAAAAQGEAAAEKKEGAEAIKGYSFGDSSLSILFLPTQVERMKFAIRQYEDTHQGSPTATTFVAPEPEMVAAEQGEPVFDPAEYPAFFLSSIVYKNQSDWSVWMGGGKITSHKNDTDVTVEHISPNAVTFSWKPAYPDALKQRQQKKLFAPTEAVKNKLAAQQRMVFDEETGRVTFTLRQNQTFTVGYFKTFEGFVPSPKLAALAQVNNAENVGAEDSFGSHLLKRVLNPRTNLPSDPRERAASIRAARATNSGAGGTPPPPPEGMRGERVADTPPDVPPPEGNGLSK